MNKRIATTQEHNAGASRLSRRLIELGEYAKREGITPQDVRKCHEIGIIQLRRHKGKTFVVDIPFCSYDNTDQIDTEVAELLGLTKHSDQVDVQQQTHLTAATNSDTKRISKALQPVKNLAAKLSSRISHLLSSTHLLGRNLLRRSRPDARLRQEKKIGTTPRQTPLPSKGRIDSGSIAQLVQEMLRRAEQIEQEQKAAQKQPEISITEVPQTPQTKSSPMTEELLSTIARRLDQIEHKTKRK